MKTPLPWREWGPYLSERQWGTVREDYSAGGDAWDYITHDMARSKAYRWGEEGLGGISDRKQHLCLALALWNERDPILKERLFGLTNNEGNHGEDVKEIYYYLDNVPSHSYMKMLYKYPQQAFPYTQLIKENARRSRMEPEFELMDTGIFEKNEYFDVFIEYAKNCENDLLAQYTVHNRGDADAPIHILPTLWFRRTPDWQDVEHRPNVSVIDKNELLLESEELGNYHCYIEEEAETLFTENETNNERLYQSSNDMPFTKDGIDAYVVNGHKDAVNPNPSGTKVALHYTFIVPAGGSVSVRLRLSDKEITGPFDGFEEIITTQRKAADHFYKKKSSQKTEDEARVLRQAMAGMLWGKQFYYYNVNQWLTGDDGEPAPPKKRYSGRNSHWDQLRAADIISMPDKWEYPWFAAWDLAFHCIALAAIDVDFAKTQLMLLLRERYMHPNGQLPAYEWNFGDVNPPVHAMAALEIYKMDREATGKADTEFLEQVFHKLMFNFTWWVNRKDEEGNNIFEGGFLGLDNIGVFDRSAPIPGGGSLEQADGTSWMAMYALNMMRMAIELACEHRPVYEDMAIKFGEHFFYIAGAMANMANQNEVGLWDEKDGFYYDMLRQGDGNWTRLKLRSLVGLLPLTAVEVIDDDRLKELPRMMAHMAELMRERPDLEALVSRWEGADGESNTHLLSLLRGHRMKCLLRRMLDEDEFLSPRGIRSLSKVYEKDPFDFKLNGQQFSVKYTPAESTTNMFGGNSNWRGPVWMPVNYLLVQSMRRFHDYYGDNFKIEMPVGTERFITISQAADEVAQRLKSLFLRDENGRRPIYGDNEKL
ncbi:glucosidase, partial [Persicitalea sp.]|uniref:MGH1-like glycoside hydrolase domain-containing protein n=1 Tax=Persicitalea sp. TaxID=3100273 RepID=UPI00359363A5